MMMYWKLGQVFYHFYQQSMLCWLSSECPWSLGSFKLIFSQKSRSRITRLNNHIMQLRSECWIVIGVWHCWHTSNWRPNDLDFSLSSFLTQCLFAHLANYNAQLGNVVWCSALWLVKYKCTNCWCGRKLEKLDGLNFSLATGKTLGFFDVICGCPLDH